MGGWCRRCTNRDDILKQLNANAAKKVYCICSGVVREYGQQVLAKSFAINEEVVVKDLSSGKNIDHNNAAEYQLDFENCKLICFHKTTQSRNSEVPGVIHSGLCYTLPLIVPDLKVDDSNTTIFNSSEKRLKFDQKLLICNAYPSKAQHSASAGPETMDADIPSGASHLPSP